MRPVLLACRRAPLRVALFALSALVLSACGVTGAGDVGTAATVGGEDITVEEVEQGVVDAEANPQVSEALQGDESGEMRSGMEVQLLTARIRSEILRQGADELGVTVTDEDVAAEREALIEQTGGQEAFEEAVAQSGLTEDEIDRRLRDQLLERRVREELAPEVSEEEIATRFEEQYAGGGPFARHILVETEEEAQEVLDRLEAGEDFGEVAREVSTDPSAQQNAGDLGAIQEGQTVPEFEEAVFGAEPGEIVGPVETQFGFHVIQVYEPTLEEVSDQIRTALGQEAGQAAFGDWLAEQSEELGVTVNPRFGEWDPQAGQVVSDDLLDEDAPGGTEPAPAGTDPAPAVTESPAADQG